MCVYVSVCVCVCMCVCTCGADGTAEVRLKGPSVLNLNMRGVDCRLDRVKVCLQHKKAPAHMSMRYPASSHPLLAATGTMLSCVCVCACVYTCTHLYD